MTELAASRKGEAHVPEVAAPLRQLVVVGDHHAPFSGGDDLVGEEAEAAECSDRSRRTTSMRSCQSVVTPPTVETLPCAVILSNRVRNSPSKPFMTDRITISAATPSEIPSNEISVMKETNRVRRLARR